jgi:HSP20 family molecular chaperone IbpA
MTGTGTVKGLFLNFKSDTMFRSTANNPCHASVYPGKYERLPGQVKELCDELARNKTVSEFPVKVLVGNDFYRVNVLAPGFVRDDFFISTKDQVLSIVGMRKIPSAHGETAKGYYSSQRECIQQEVILPPDVDTEFVSAEYANGTLSIWVFRTKTPVINKPVHIIVH